MSEFSEQDVASYRTWRRNIAHDVINYDLLSDTSLSYRVCQGNAAISSSATISQDYGTISAYLEEGGMKGRLMCALALAAWYCTVAKELYATSTSTRVTLSIPLGDRTRIVKLPPPSIEESGAYVIVQISAARLIVRLTVTLMRITIAFWMWLQVTAV